jgi:hypothetical protein
MEHSPPVETNNPSSGEEIPRLLFNPMLDCRVQNIPPLYPILSQINPVRILNFCLFKTLIVAYAYSLCPSGLLHAGFPIKIWYALHPSHACYIHRPSHQPYFKGKLKSILFYK